MNGARYGSLIALMLLATPAIAAPVYFDWFQYSGHDAVFERPLPPGGYRNPVLAGFHPDPSVTRAGDRFYLVTSTFTYFPGIPVFESADLVHWRQIGNVIARASEFDFDGLAVSRGVFASTIRFHDGTFYVVSTAVDSGGTFIVTATNPAGPWSPPSRLPGIDGIDPSLFFDTDGKAYVLNNGPPPGPAQYEGHRAIWMQELDVQTHTLVGPRRVLLDGGVNFSKHPVWIEGPHLYRVGGWYYLMCAQGGTSTNHSEVVLRSHSPWGPFAPFAGNPILTQRDLDPARPDPVVNAGHADLIQAADQSWWAVFLACRAYGGGHFNTGRETFLLPVHWHDGWPTILEHGRSVPYVVRGPHSLGSGAHAAPTSGNFTWRDDFDGPRLKPEWLQVRTPKRAWADLRRRPGWLAIEPRAMPLDGLGNPSFLARRQQHTVFDASTSLELPRAVGVAAGLAAFQNQDYWYFLGVRRMDAQLSVFLERKSGHAVEVLARAAAGPGDRVAFRISAHAGTLAFFYDVGGGWKPLVLDADGTLLSTDVAGGFVGTVVGPYAVSE